MRARNLRHCVAPRECAGRGAGTYHMGGSGPNQVTCGEPSGDSGAQLRCSRPSGALRSVEHAREPGGCREVRGGGYAWSGDPG